MKTASTRSTAEPRHPRRHDATSLDVLLAEDDALLAGHLVRALGRHGMAVRCAHGGRDAVAEAARRPPDVLVLALELPDLTGFEVTRVLREERSTHHVPVLLLARRGDAQSRAAAWGCGADGMLARPFLPSQIVSAVSVLASRGRRERALGASTVESTRLLLGLLEERAPGARLHGERCAQLVVAFAQFLGLSEPEVGALEHAALLHDVGRMLLPGTSRHAPSCADRPHAWLGANLLESLPELAALAPAVRHHHDRFDGRGSPDGTAGDAIPLAARMLAVGDALIVLRMSGGTVRPPARSVLRELDRRSDAGEFDPDLVRPLREAVLLDAVPA